MDKTIEPNYQMKRLRDMLDAEGIAWHDDSSFGIVRTHSDERTIRTAGHKHGGCNVFSVICGEFTYGGPEGLEAWMYDEAEPRGYATAEQVMRRIRKVVKKVGA